MKPFRATYTPERLNTRKGDDKEGDDFILSTVPNTDKASPVLIVAFQESQAVFIYGNGVLDMDTLDCFTNCHGMEGLNAS